MIIVDMERTAGSLTINVGGATATLSSTGKHVRSIKANSGHNDFRITAGTTFAGKIKETSVRGVMVISYNHLNQPEIITQAGDQQLQYIYDANGKKLCQIFSKNNITEKRTDYVGEFYYENDTLKFINHEEGRIVPEADGSYTYQYHLKDHLGSTRLTFTTKEEITSATATMEIAHESEEAEEFLYYEEAVKVNTPLFDHTNEGATYYSTRLNGSSNEQFGLAKSISVMPGDTIRAQVFAKYLDTDNNNWTQALTDFMAAIAGGTAPAGTVVDGGFTGSTGGTTPSHVGLLNKSNESGTAPKAYLNWLVFDRSYNLVNGGFVRMSDAAREFGQDGAHEELATEIPISEAGYAYIYLSNDNVALGGDQTECYFDDLQIVHVQSPIVQSDTYFPFGGRIEELSYRRENSVKNKYLYNGGAELQEDMGLEVYLTDLRVEDMWGRPGWWQIDPMADPLTWRKSSA